MNNPKDGFVLNNGVLIPCIGFGTWRSAEGEMAVEAVKCAISLGYRHIDTAAKYENESSVGTAIRQCGVDRREIFVTSKVWNTERGYDKTLAAFETTMSKLKLDYLDLYLIHWPADPSEEKWRAINLETWRALEKLYNEGRIRAIGLSNFQIQHLNPLLEEAAVTPMINQIEYHPGLTQDETVDFCKKNNIIVEAWRPLDKGRILGNERLKNIADSYGKTLAQICIKWALQNGVLPLPKSTTPSRIAENINVFDFEISEKDMELIRNIGQSAVKESATLL